MYAFIIKGRKRKNKGICTSGQKSAQAVSETLELNDLRRKSTNKHGIARIIQLNSKNIGGGYKRNSNKGADTGIDRSLMWKNVPKYLKKQETYDIIFTIRGAIDPDSREKKIWAHKIKNCVTVYFFL